MNLRKFRTVPNLASVILVNAGESRSVVGSETDTIARAMSILYGVIGGHPGRLTYAHACDVVMWATDSSMRGVEV